MLHADSPSGRQALAPALLAICLAGLAAWQLLAAPEEDIARIAMPVRPAAASAPARPQAAAADLAAILERPLFVDGRRRAEPASAVVEAVPAAEEPPLSASYRLVGLATRDGQVVALLRDAGGTLIRLRSGMQLGAWTLAGSGGPRIATFSRDGAQQTLVMVAATAPAAPTNDETDE